MNLHRSTWYGLLLGLAGVLLTGCTMAGARGATISTITRSSQRSRQRSGYCLACSASTSAKSGSPVSRPSERPCAGWS